jgi:predicted 3-demethylubiquinone-9 3-methyltransferase (glyoxalase superfamily)
MSSIQTITPCLWFDGQAEEAVALYTSTFPNSRITTTTRYGKAGQEFHRKPVGSVMTIGFELNGQGFTALNGGPLFKFTEAISLQVNCRDQAEIDHYWEKLSAGGDPSAQQCGWLKDRFGLSWQIVPAKLSAWVSDPDPARSQRVMEALFQMTKLDFGALERAFAG